ncbi:MAG: GAF domain-containing protein [Chloroflexi bacterium]|nr:GAF domain-containing protein [Chloroflexota bacterium]
MLESQDRRDQYMRESRLASIVFSLFGLIMSLVNIAIWQSNGKIENLALAMLGLVMVAVSLTVLVLTNLKRPGYGIWIISALLILSTGVGAVYVNDVQKDIILWILSFVIVLMHLQMQPTRLGRFYIGTAIFLYVVTVAWLFFTDLPPRVDATVTGQFFTASLLTTLVVYGGLRLSQYNNYNLRTKLIFSILGAIILITLSFFSINAANASATFQSNAQQSLLAIASETSSRLDAFIESNLNAIQTEATLPTIRQFMLQNADGAVEDDVLADARTTLQALPRKDAFLISSYGLLDSNGINVLDSLAVNVGRNEAEQDYFQEVLATSEPYISDLVFDARQGQFHAIYFSAPVTSASGDILGVLRMRITAVVLQELIRESNDVAGRDSFGVLFQEIEGNYLHLAHGIAPDTIYTTVVPFAPAQLAALQIENRLPPERELSENSGAAEAPETIFAQDLPELLDNLSQVDEQSTFSSLDVATGDRVNQVAQLRLDSRPNWIVAFFQPEDVSAAALARQSKPQQLSLLFYTVLLIIAGYVVSELISRPIQQLTKVAQQLGEGDLDTRANAESQDELGILAVNMNSMAERLSETISGLEDTVAERTAELEQRARYLEAAADVGRTAAEITNLEDLLSSVTHLISERFGYYHTGIFLIDNAREYAELRAANSEGGWRMLARNHKLRVGEQGIVGYVTSTGKPRIEQAVLGDEETVHYQNPDLPLTRSEMALPLMSGGQILGALDVQSIEEEAFSEEDVATLQVLADQVAIAINNALLIQQVQARLEAERRAYGEISSQAWAERLQLHPISGIRSNPLGLSALNEPLDLHSQTAVEEGVTVHPERADGQDQLPLYVPIKVRGDTVVGVLETHKDAATGTWTDEEVQLLENLSEQLGIALENARLFEETQRLAQRERIAADVSSKVWASGDVEAILQTAVQELGRALNVSEGVIQLDIDGNGTETPPELPSTDEKNREVLTDE